MLFGINLLALVLVIIAFRGVLEHWKAYQESYADELTIRQFHKERDVLLLRGVKGDQREELLRLFAKLAFFVVYMITLSYPLSLLLVYDWRAITVFSLQFLALGLLSASTYYRRVDRKRQIQDALIIEAAENHIIHQEHTESPDGTQEGSPPPR